MTTNTRISLIVLTEFLVVWLIFDVILNLAFTITIVIFMFVVITEAFVDAYLMAKRDHDKMSK